VIGKFTGQPLGHLSSGFASQKVSDDLLRDLPDEVFGYFWIDILIRKYCAGEMSDEDWPEAPEPLDPSEAPPMDPSEAPDPPDPSEAPEPPDPSEAPEPPDQ
jgi:hypothetical protein